MRLQGRDTTGEQRVNARLLCGTARYARRMSLSSVDHIVVLMLENRSFDHMLGFLYAANANVSPAGALFDGLTGNESNPDSSANAVPAPTGTRHF